VNLKSCRRARERSVTRKEYDKKLPLPLCLELTYSAIASGRAAIVSKSDNVKPVGGYNAETGARTAWEVHKT
jgi:hypothetical protein